MRMANSVSPSFVVLSFSKLRVLWSLKMLIDIRVKIFCLFKMIIDIILAWTKLLINSTFVVIRCALPISLRGAPSHYINYSIRVSDLYILQRHKQNWATTIVKNNFLDGKTRIGVVYYWCKLSIDRSFSNCLSRYRLMSWRILFFVASSFACSLYSDCNFPFIEDWSDAYDFPEQIEPNLELRTENTAFY